MSSICIFLLKLALLKVLLAFKKDYLLQLLFKARFPPIRQCQHYLLFNTRKRFKAPNDEYHCPNWLRHRRKSSRQVIGRRSCEPSPLFLRSRAKAFFVHWKTSLKGQSQNFRTPEVLSIVIVRTKQAISQTHILSPAYSILHLSNN